MNIEEKYIEAKKMYLKYACNKFWMSREGVDDKYDALNVPRILEQEWENEYVEKKRQEIEIVLTELQDNATEASRKVREENLWIQVSNISKVAPRLDNYGNTLSILINSVEKQKDTIGLLCILLICDELIDYIGYSWRYYEYLNHREIKRQFSLKDMMMLSDSLNRIEVLFNNRVTNLVEEKSEQYQTEEMAIEQFYNKGNLINRKNDLNDKIKITKRAFARGSWVRFVRFLSHKLVHRC
jgi:hypothetical protein